MGLGRLMMDILRQLECDWVRAGIAREGEFLVRCESCHSTTAASCRECDGWGWAVTHQGWRMLAWAKPSGSSR